MASNTEKANIVVTMDGKQAEKLLQSLTANSKTLKKELDEVRKMEDSPERTKKMKELTSQIKASNSAVNDLGIQLRDTSAEIENMGELSVRQLKRLRNELIKTRDSVRRSPEEIKKMNEEIDAVSRRIQQQTGQINKQSGVWGQLGASVKKYAGAAGLLAIAAKAAQWIGQMASAAKEFIKEGIQMASVAEGIVTAFNKIENSSDLLKDLRRETKGLINDVTLMQTAVKAQNFNIPLGNLGTLLKFAQQRAQETGESVDYLVNSIVNGIGRKSALVLDNLGISASRLQDEVKRTGDFATAAINIVNEELEKQGDLALTSADKATQSTVKWANAQEKVGRSFLGIKNVWSEMSGNMADWVSRFADNTLPKIIKGFEDMVNALIDMYNSFILVRGVIHTIGTAWDLIYNSVAYVVEKVGIMLMGTARMLDSLVRLDFGSIKASYNKMWEDLAKSEQKRGENIAKSFSNAFNKTLSGSIDPVDYTSPTEGGTPGKEPTKTTDPESAKKAAEERLKAEMDALAHGMQLRRNALRQQYVDEKMDRETFHRELEALEMDYLNKQLALYDADPAKVAEIQEKILQLRQKAMETQVEDRKKLIQELDKLDELFATKGLSREEKELVRLRVSYNNGLTLLEESFANKLLTEEEYYKMREELRLKYEDAAQQASRSSVAAEKLGGIDSRESEERFSIAEDYINKTISYEEYLRKLSELEAKYALERLMIDELNESQRADMQLRYQELRLDQMNELARKEKEIQDKRNEILTSSIKELGSAFGELFSNQEDALAKFGESLVDLAFDTLMGLVDVWLMQMQAKALAATFEGGAQAVGSKGILGLAEAAVIAAAIQGALQIAKAGIKSLIGKGGSDAKAATGQRVVKSSGFSVGGDTGSGGTFQPAGIVHKEEYVVPQMVMRDPVAFNHVRVLESIRRNKYHLNANPLRGYADGGGVGTEVLPAAPANDPALTDAVDELNGLLKDLKRSGIRAILNYSNLKNQSQQIENSINRGSRPK